MDRASTLVTLCTVHTHRSHRIIGILSTLVWGVHIALVPVLKAFSYGTALRSHIPNILSWSPAEQGTDSCIACLADCFLPEHTRHTPLISGFTYSSYCTTLCLNKRCAHAHCKAQLFLYPLHPLHWFLGNILGTSVQNSSSKGQCHEIFWLWFFWSNIFS